MRTEQRGSAMSLRKGSLTIAVGLAFFAGATYVFTGVTTRALGPVGFSEFSVFWGLVYGVGLGVALPFEQETSRRVAELSGRGDDAEPVFATAVRAAGLLTAVAAVLVVVPLAIVLSRGSGHAVVLAVTSVAALAGLSAAYVTRGALSGSRHFRTYAVQVGMEGLLRIVGAGVLAVLAVRSPWPYAALVSVALILAVLLTGWHWWRGARRVATHDLSPYLAALVAIVIASTIAQCLVNFGPVVVHLLDKDRSGAAAGSFLAAALIARTPTFAFAAVQAVLIPRLVEAVVRRDAADYRRILATVLAGVTALSLVAVALCAAAGPWLMHLLAGPGYDLPRTDIVLLAVSTGVYLMTLALQPAAVAVSQHRRTAIVWIVAAMVFVALCLLPVGPVRAVNVAMVGSMTTAAVGLWAIIMRAVGRYS